MLIHLSELFNCEGRKKVYTVETALDSVDFDGETFQIEKAEPFYYACLRLLSRHWTWSWR